MTNAANARRRLRDGMFRDTFHAEDRPMPTEQPPHDDAPADDLRRPVGTRVVVRRLDVPAQIVGIGVVAEVLRAVPVRGDYCRVVVSYGAAGAEYTRWADELELAAALD